MISNEQLQELFDYIDSYGEDDELESSCEEELLDEDEIDGDDDGYCRAGGENDARELIEDLLD